MARLDANKFEIPTPVQAGCIPPALEGRDVLATAQTGTGKTLSFLDSDRGNAAKDRRPRGAQALILLPTRELAMQVEKAFRAIRTSSFADRCAGGGRLAEGSQLEPFAAARA
jgi:ATP-dependent RNA helicase RhlE